MSNNLQTLGVECTKCGEGVFMLTCHNWKGTGHDWVLAGICPNCRSIHWTDGCHACQCKDPNCPDCTITTADLPW
jgi:hypothetical protein